MTKPTPGPWRIFDAFTDIEIVTDYCDGRQSFTESIVQFKGQRNACANAAWIVCAVNSHDALLRTCRLLLQAYPNGEASEHVDWDDVDRACNAAQLALAKVQP
jgi:hypothetical protein